MKPVIRSLKRPLGTGGEQRARFLRHHLPLALASAAVLALFMMLPRFDASASPHADIFSGAFPQQRSGDGGMDRSGAWGRLMDHGMGQRGSMHHGRGRSEATDHDGTRARPIDHAVAPTGPMDDGEQQGAFMNHDGDEGQQRASMRQLTFATGYVALGLLTLTLLIGPANLLLRRRNPVSNYLRRDAGTWTAIFSVVHVIFGLQVHGGARISAFLSYFVATDSSLLLNSFGLGNWTGLAAVVITVGLLATSSDAALRKLKARRWKWLQRLNYGLFALVLLHAFFYGALLRMTSAYSLLLGLSVVVVFGGQSVGIVLWRRRYAR